MTSALFLGVFAALFPVSTVGHAQPQVSQSHLAPAEAATPVAFIGGTVVNVIDGTLLPDQTVVIAGNRIQTVGPTRQVRLPKGTQTIDARGKYLIPGLWDMHVHTWGYPDIFYPLLIANGVTGVREMSQVFGLDSLHKWRREILAGRRVGPRVIGTGPIVGNARIRRFQPMWRKPLIAAPSTPAEGRDLVDSLHAAGADFIKPHDDLSADIYFAAATEARRINIPFAGHVPVGVTAAEASDSGQRSIEHMYSGNEGKFGICEGLEDATGTVSNADSAVEGCRALATRLAYNQTWVVPTLTVLRYAFARAPFTHAPERLRYWPDTVAKKANELIGWGFMRTKAFYEPKQRSVGALWRLGAPILAGTDAESSALARIVPGFSLHDELVLLVEAGLTPLAALQAATLNPAQYLRATDSLGTVAQGKLADLILLDADPLADIHNTTKVHAVVANGRYFDRATLDRTLAAAEYAAKGKNKD